MISQFAQAVLTLHVPLQYHFAIESAKHGPSEPEIATCAYMIWEHEGRPQGREKIHWAQARAQLIACHEHDQWLSTWHPLLVEFSSEGQSAPTVSLVASR